MKKQKSIRDLSKKDSLKSRLLAQPRFTNLFLLLLLVFLLVLLRLQQSVLANNPPTCLGLQASPKSGGAVLQVFFSGRGSIQDGKITQARFVFGDQAEDIRIEDFGKLAEITTSHAYKLPGTYQAKFFLKSNGGIETGETKTCQVEISVEGETLPAVRI